MPDYLRICCSHCGINLHLNPSNATVSVRFSHLKAVADTDHASRPRRTWFEWNCPSCGVLDAYCV